MGYKNWNAVIGVLDPRGSCQMEPAGVLPDSFPTGIKMWVGLENAEIEI